MRLLSAYAYDNSGWRLRPVTGFLTLKEYLYHLAFKMYPATQYLRHYVNRDYNPEPDLIHDVFGHVSTLMNPGVYELHHKAGLASLGASDEVRELIAAVLWYTFEVGLCYDEQGKRSLLGGSLLSSVDEATLAMNPMTPLSDIGDLNSLRYSDI